MENGIFGYEKIIFNKWNVYMYIYIEVSFIISIETYIFLYV